MPCDDIIIRPMTHADIPDGMRLKTAAGWNQTANDWRMYLDIGGNGCFAAELNGKVVGTVTTVNYGSAFSWIGMMLVDPGHRRKGIGSCLMNRAIEYLEGQGAIRLDATPLGKTVYDRLGFVDEYSLTRMVCPYIALAENSGSNVTGLAERDSNLIGRFDVQAFGADRSDILKNLIRLNPEASWKKTEGKAVRGYCTGRPGTKYYQIGPVVAESAGHAIDVTAAAFRSLEGSAVVIDVPDAQREYIAFIESAGFRAERPLIRMCRGENKHPGNPGLVYGICGPEVG